MGTFLNRTDDRWREKYLEKRRAHYLCEKNQKGAQSAGRESNRSESGRGAKGNQRRRRNGFTFLFVNHSEMNRGGVAV